jgi:hypothetical protein
MPCAAHDRYRATSQPGAQVRSDPPMVGRSNQQRACLGAAAAAEHRQRAGNLAARLGAELRLGDIVANQDTALRIGHEGRTVIGIDEPVVGHGKWQAPERGQGEKTRGDRDGADHQIGWRRAHLQGAKPGERCHCQPDCGCGQTGTMAVGPG